MLIQAISILSAAVAFQGTAAAPAKAETVNLQRIYKAGDTETYALTATLDEEGGMQASIAGRLVLKILTDGKDKSAEVEFSMPQFTMTANGAEVDTPAAEARKTKLDKNGMPTHLGVKESEWVYVLFSIGGYLPAEEIAVGKEFPISWSADGNTIKGKATLSEIVVEDGKKVAVIKTTANVAPQDDTPGDVELTSRVDVETGKLIEAKGKVKIGGHTNATFTLKKVKAAK